MSVHQSPRLSRPVVHSLAYPAPLLTPAALNLKPGPACASHPSESLLTVKATIRVIISESSSFPEPHYSSLIFRRAAHRARREAPPPPVAHAPAGSPQPHAPAPRPPPPPAQPQPPAAPPPVPPASTAAHLAQQQPPPPPWRAPPPELLPADISITLNLSNDAVI